ncbi:MAG: formyltetrahydrofolate deformylase [Candidatus Omnitrophota bacterium]
MANAILLISCRDQKGITAGVTNFIFHHGGNIIHADQHIDEQSNTFFMRVEWNLQGFQLTREGVRGEFAVLAERFQMKWDLFFSEDMSRLAIFVSKQVHCLYDLLWRHQAGYLQCEIPLVISNHEAARSIANEFNIDFVHIPVDLENKAQAESVQLDLLKEYEIDLAVLARYHQILTVNFLQRFKNKIINIHHSFLPSFPGKQPYDQAYQRGVKIIGATSHYVTPELDQGPIIEQDTVRVSHRDSRGDLVRKGEDLERMVLARAVRWELERKILCYHNKTVVFA